MVLKQQKKASVFLVLRGSNITYDLMGRKCNSIKGLDDYTKQKMSIMKRVELKKSKI